MTEVHIKIGKLLRMERTRKEIALEDIAADLKITEENLLAVEEGDVGRVPSELYFNLFAKAYAEELGIDYEATIEAIKQDLENSSAEAELAQQSAGDDAASGGDGEPMAEQADKSSGGADHVHFRKLAWILGIVVVIFIVLLVANELFFKSDETTDEYIPPAQTVTEPEDEAVVDTKMTSAYDWNVPGYTPPDSLKLVLTARTESWAAVLADGDTAIYRTLTPGRRYEVAAAYRLRVSVGVPSAVMIELNGQQVNLRNPESGRISGVKIDQVNLREFLDRPLTGTTGRRPAPSPPAETQLSKSDTVQAKSDDVDTVAAQVNGEGR